MLSEKHLTQRKIDRTNCFILISNGMPKLHLNRAGMRQLLKITDERLTNAGGEARIECPGSPARVYTLKELIEVDLNHNCDISATAASQNGIASLVFSMLKGLEQQGFADGNVSWSSVEDVSSLTITPEGLKYAHTLPSLCKNVNLMCSGNGKTQDELLLCMFAEGWIAQTWADNPYYDLLEMPPFTAR